MNFGSNFKNRTWQVQVRALLKKQILLDFTLLHRKKTAGFSSPRVVEGTYVYRMSIVSL